MNDKNQTKMITQRFYFPIQTLSGHFLMKTNDDENQKQDIFVYVICLCKREDRAFLWVCNCDTAQAAQDAVVWLHPNHVSHVLDSILPELLYCSRELAAGRIWEVTKLRTLYSPRNNEVIQTYSINIKFPGNKENRSNNVHQNVLYNIFSVSRMMFLSPSVFFALFKYVLNIHMCFHVLFLICP